MIYLAARAFGPRLIIYQKFASLIIHGIRSGRLAARTVEA